LLRPTEQSWKRQHLSPLDLENAMNLLNSHTPSTVPILKEHHTCTICESLVWQIESHGKIDDTVDFSLYDGILKETHILAGQYTLNRFGIERQISSTNRRDKKM